MSKINIPSLKPAPLEKGAVNALNRPLISDKKYYSVSRNATNSTQALPGHPNINFNYGAAANNPNWTVIDVPK